MSNDLPYLEAEEALKIARELAKNCNHIGYMDAEDIAQATVIKLEKRGTPYTEANLKWALGTCRVDMIRTLLGKNGHKKVTFQPLEEITPFIYHTSHELEVDARDFLETLERRLSGELLLVWWSLKESDHQAEAASLIGMPLSTYYRRIKDIRRVAKELTQRRQAC